MTEGSTLFAIFSLIGDIGRVMTECGPEFLFFLAGTVSIIYGCVVVVKQKATVHDHNDDLLEVFSPMEVQNLSGVKAVRYGIRSMIVGFLLIGLFFFYDQFTSTFVPTEAEQNGHLQE